MMDAGVLAETDLQAIEVAAYSYERWQSARVRVSELETRAEEYFRSGNSEGGVEALKAASAAATEEVKWMQMFNQSSAKLAWNPVDRQKLRQAAPEKPQNPFAEFLKKQKAGA